MKRINVLVSSAGVASAVNVIKSLRLQQEFDVGIIAADSDPTAPGLFLADSHTVSPRVSDPNAYLDFVKETCSKHGITVMFPCYSGEIALVASRSDELREAGIQTFLPSREAVDLCDDKLRFLELAEGLDLPVPKRIEKPTEANLPFFTKLVRGSSSHGAILLDDARELSRMLDTSKDRLYQEYIEGDEYTVDVLCDRNSHVVFCGPRRRLSTKAGQSVKGVTVENPILTEYVSTICKAVNMVGVCNVQFIERGGVCYLIELNPRFAAGGLMLTLRAGANLPLGVLKLALGMPVHESEFEHRPGVVMTRYWEEIILEQ